jgi:hypothetical protein
MFDKHYHIIYIAQLYSWKTDELCNFVMGHIVFLGNYIQYYKLHIDICFQYIDCMMSRKLSMI